MCKILASCFPHGALHSTTWKNSQGKACSCRSDSLFPSPGLRDSGVLTPPVATSQMSGGSYPQDCRPEGENNRLAGYYMRVYTHRLYFPNVVVVVRECCTVPQWFKTVLQCCICYLSRPVLLYVQLHEGPLHCRCSRLYRAGDDFARYLARDCLPRESSCCRNEVRPSYSVL